MDNSLSGNIWTCTCGAWNAKSRTTCGACEEKEIMANKRPKEEILKILKTIKEDFEMLQDGRWNLNYSDDSAIEASIENCDKIIKAVERLNKTKDAKVEV